MADEVLEDWSTNANTSTNISLVCPSYENGAHTIQTLHSFDPLMTYAIFGEEETIFGYKGLKINLKYGATDMRPGLQISYTKKFKTVGETEAQDLKSIFEDFLPKTAFEKQSVFENAISSPDLVNWTPPGEVWQNFEVGGNSHEIRMGSLSDLPMRQMIRRLQVLVPFYIEGGVLLLPPGEDDDEEDLKRWTVFLLYQKRPVDHSSKVSPYTFMGFCTVYKYYPLLPKSNQPKEPATTDFDTKLSCPEVAFSSIPCRSRISQFIILPPFQKGGNGSRFYKSIFEFYYKEIQTAEITVEDPNETFDDMRDINDLTFLRTLPEFLSLKINTDATTRAKGIAPNDIVDLDYLEELRRKVKIAPRQFYRVVEMQLLSYIPVGIRQSLLLEKKPLGKVGERLKREHEYHLWQILVKKRLYRHNKQALMQLDRTERIEKLDETLGNVEADYARLLNACNSRSLKTATPISQTTGSTIPASNTPASNSKRSSPDMASEEDAPRPVKKIRFV